MPPSERSGLLAAGNFIVDHVKIIDYYPKEEMLATILSQSAANGGGPYNVLKDLAKMGAPFPLEAVGLVGEDAAAAWIREDCAHHGIGTSRLKGTARASTSYTDAFTVQSTGRRTFFHQPGTNALLAPADIDLKGSTAKLFYLGYLMLLDTLDTLLPDGTTGAAQVLAAALESGFETVVDCVSKMHPDYARVGAAALPFTDVLILNEIEAGRLAGIELSADGAFQVNAAFQAGKWLLGAGVRRAVVIHAVDGAVAVDSDGQAIHQTSVQIPPSFIQGATGAGDAFAAGFIYGWHESAPLAQCLRQAVCAAACCLSHPTTSEGMLPMADCLELGEKFGFR
jgi:sugar/nucleoside kinase (ribokinase family)